MGHLLLRGNSYSEITLDRSGNVEAVWPIRPDAIERVVRDGTWVYKEIGQNGPVIPDRRILHILGISPNGYVGYSPITVARESLGLGLATEQYGAAFFGNSATPSGLLVHPQRLTPEARQNVRREWEGSHGGLGRSHRIGVMGEGIEWQQVGLSAEDSQFLESRQFQVREIARWFNCPPHKLRDLEDATFSNIEEENIEFVQDTLQPWVERFEQAMNIKLLSPREREAGLFIELVLDNRLRGDTEKRGGFYSSQFNIGAITPNEVRKKENMDPVEGGDQAFVQLNMVPLAQALSMSMGDRVRLLEAANGIESREQVMAPEARGIIGRKSLIRTFGGPIEDAFTRMVIAEIRNLARGFKRSGGSLPDFLRFLEHYYFNDNPQLVRRTMDPILAPFARAIATEASGEVDADRETPDLEPTIDVYLDNLSNRTSARSRFELIELANNTDDLEADLEGRYTEWKEGTNTGRPRAQRLADQETVQMSNFVAKSVFGSLGVTVLRWRTSGDNCPYCEAMNGKVVGIEQPFFGGGDKEFQPDGADAPLPIRRKVFHPPLHKGCDCDIVPG